MTSKVLILASEVGLWAEELQAPWDAITGAGHELTLATHRGLKPLPLKISMDPTFVDPFQNYLVNPPEVVDRTKEILAGDAWDHPIRIEDARMADYDAIVIVGGPGAALDLVGNPNVHALLVEAYQSDKLMAALCYAVAAFIWARDPANGKSIMRGRRVAAHPMQWDFKSDMTYDLYGVEKGDEGTNLVTAGFVFPLEVIVDDAVGPDGYVNSDENANRETPCVEYDDPFLTALSVESSIAFGERIVEVLAARTAKHATV